MKQIMTNQIDVNMIERAKLLATEYHKEQTRKNGDPFIIHPTRIVDKLLNSDDSRECIIKYKYLDYNILGVLGWLHDVVEDTEFKLEEAELLFGPEISSRIDVLTRRDNEDYFDYGNRVLYSKNRLVYLVKLADIEDNLDSIGDGAFNKKKENRLAMRWEWLRFHLLNNLADCK